jgi:hypothetical protein
VVSHSTTQKSDHQASQPAPASPEQVTPDLSAPASLLQDVIHLQRLIGNRATSQLISSKNKAPASTLNRSASGSGAMIQRVMTAEAFKQKTKVDWSTRSDALEKIDLALKEIEQAGADALLLGELQKAIEAWFNTKEADGPRRDGVKALQAEVSEELRQVREHREDQGVVLDAPAAGPSKQYKKDFSDFDTKQFRVSGRAPNRMIEEVKRVAMDDGSVVYYAMGVVTDFNGKTPVISPYPEPLPLGDWYPEVTHINGMDVNPQEGLLAASALQESVNKALEGEDDVAFGQDAVDVLFTYSAKRGGMTADLWDCIKGKVEVEDGATEKQKEIMLDAVRNKHRTTVSAHSRGTIKTDNAVMSVHDLLSAEYLPGTRAEYYEHAVAHWQAFADQYGVSAEEMAEMTVKQVAGKKAKEDMNQYIQLIYAGNAVSLPSSVLKPSMYVGGMDMVSMSVGSYTSTLMGTKSVGAFKGHEFIGNYVPSVSKEIAEDIKKR